MEDIRAKKAVGKLKKGKKSKDKDKEEKKSGETGVEADGPKDKCVVM